MTPTPRPWKERREEIEKYKAEPWATVIRDCLREIDRRGELIERLAFAIHNARARWPQEKLATAQYDDLLREADEVDRG